MHAGQVIATQRLGKLTKKATHYHPFDENCAHLVTQLSWAHEVRLGVPEEGRRGHGVMESWLLRFGKYTKENSSVQN